VLIPSRAVSAVTIADSPRQPEGGHRP
jgi:hypothetical protein